MKRIIVILCTGMPIIALCLAISQIVLTNQFVGSGKTVHSIDVSIDTVRRENEQLDQLVASASSLIAVSARATALGFVEPEKIQYVTIGTSQLPVAFNKPQ